MVAAKLANMPRGGNREEHHSANLHSASDAADMLNVSEMSVKPARKVTERSREIANAAVRHTSISKLLDFPNLTRRLASYWYTICFVCPMPGLSSCAVI